MELRQQAEKQLRERVARLPETGADLSLEAVRQMFHELQVHQIELEMQNEELRRTHAELDMSAGALFRFVRPGPGGLLHLE